MRILQVAQKPQRRGPEILARQLNQEFQRKGHQVHLIYLYDYQGNVPLPINGESVALHGDERHVFEKFPTFHPLLLHRLVDEIRRFAPDVVQANGSRTVKYCAFAKWGSPGDDWALVYRNIDNPAYWVNHSIHHLYYRYLVMPRMDGVIGVSDSILKTVREMYGISAPAVTIPYVADPERLEPILSQAEARQRINKPDGAPIVLFLGNLSEQKRPDRFLRVVFEARKQIPDLQALILGDGPLLQDVEEQIQDLDLVDAVDVLGYQAEVGPYISASDVLLVTSDSDGIPTVVQEAGYLGKPTICTRVGGLAECVIDDVTGLLIEPTAEADFVNAVVGLLDDSSRRLEMGRAARQHVLDNFTIHSVVDNHLDFYQHLMGRER